MVLAVDACFSGGMGRGLFEVGVIVSYSIRNCIFGFRCEKQWGMLKKTEEEGVRYCSQCQENVFFCGDDESFLEAVRDNQCIAIEDDETGGMTLGIPDREAMADYRNDIIDTDTEVAAFTIAASFEGRVEYRLFKTDDKARFYRLTYVNRGGSDKLEVHQVHVSSAHIRACLNELKNAQIPANPTFADGLDGGIYTLMLSHGLSETTYTWWTYYPKGYEPLAAFAEALMEASGFPYHPLCSIERSPMA